MNQIALITFWRASSLAVLEKNHFPLSVYARQHPTDSGFKSHRSLFICSAVLRLSSAVSLELDSKDRNKKRLDFPAFSPLS